VETNLMEHEQGPPLALTDGKVTVPIHPYEILALQIDYPHTPVAAETK
jgi:alpha-mannosidase